MHSFKSNYCTHEGIGVDCDPQDRMLEKVLSLLDALKIAYCYMPESNELTAEQFGENIEKVKEEVEAVRAVLVAEGVDPDKIYNELNPPLNSPVSPSTKALIDLVKSES